MDDHVNGVCITSSFAIHQNTYRQLESRSQIPLLPASFSSNIKIWLKFPSLFPSARNLTPINQKSCRPSPCIAVFLISQNKKHLLHVPIHYRFDEDFRNLPQLYSLSFCTLER
ncbi:hypothetical protein DVH24_006638 [Malus domestica]|uniref:Uncharacterized protein n=1 Tax=Malus domestica TaxID=3750 RepID=A0A498KDA3_MALDO|nr:hypothetical protein DVH24_006638 [Malus domestica]